MTVSNSQNNLEKDNWFQKKILSLLDSESIFVDVGTSRGESIFPIIQKIDRISIYAIEPNLVKFEQLKQNSLQWEKKSSNKIYSLNIAISDRDGQESFMRSQLSNERILFKSNLSKLKDAFNETSSWEEITVDAFKLDTLFKPIKPTLIKIDVGGDELKILQGSVNLLKEGKTKFLINLKHQYVTQDKDYIEQIHKFMRAFDYTPQKFDEAILFVNHQKSDRYLVLFKNLKKWFRYIIPTDFYYKAKELIKK